MFGLAAAGALAGLSNRRVRVTRADEWVGWNSWRGPRDDFNRQFIFSLAQARADPSQWLFGGVFEVLARRPMPRDFSYDVELREDYMGAFIKRLMVAFRLPGRSVRLNLETHLDRIEVVSVLPQPYAGEPFPGHDQINHTLGELEVVVAQRRPDWHGALQHMKAFTSSTTRSPPSRMSARPTATPGSGHA